MLPPEWKVISMSAMLAAVSAWVAAIRSVRYPSRVPGIDAVHVVRMRVAGIAAGHRLEGADVHERNRDHRAGEGVRIEFPDELGDRERPLLLVAVDAAVDQQHRPRPRAVRDEHRESERRAVHPLDGRYEPGSALAGLARDRPDGEFLVLVRHVGCLSPVCSGC